MRGGTPARRGHAGNRRRGGSGRRLGTRTAGVPAARRSARRTPCTAARGWTCHRAGCGRRRHDGRSAMSEERRLVVLRAIVQDYVQTSEPVGSKALVERHHLGVTAATVRNDMALLEEEGLIAAPHTTAGRVPTDAGYRLFVDRLSAVKPLSPGERAAISRVPRGRCRPRRRRRPHGAPARLADPPGGGHAVPLADPLDGAPHRARPAGPRTPDGRAHRQHRSGRAAGHRDPPRPRLSGRGGRCSRGCAPGQRGGGGQAPRRRRGRPAVAARAVRARGPRPRARRRALARRRPRRGA